MERKLGVVGEMITACDVLSHPLQMLGEEEEEEESRWRMGLGFGPSPFSCRLSQSETMIITSEQTAVQQR